MISTVFILIILTIIILKLFRKKTDLPGPLNLPIIGYLHKLDPLTPHLTFTELAKKYGPVYSIKLGMVSAAVIADAKILKKLLTRQDTVLRPPFYVLDIVFQRKGLICTDVDLWKDQRKFVQNFLKVVGGSRASQNKSTCEALIRKHSQEFVQVVKNHDGVAINPSELISHYIVNITGTLFVGNSFSMNKNTVTEFSHCLEEITKALASPLNFFPFLRFLPIFKKHLTLIDQVLHRIRKIQNQLLSQCEKSNSKTDLPSSLIETFLMQMSKDNQHIYNLNQLHHLLLDLSLAFFDTTTTSLQWIVLYLAQHEEVQNRVRQEILDRPVDDFLNLHYTRATLAEVARIRSIASIAFPHYASENISIENFTIPKGTLLMPLLWAIHMDPHVFAEPEEFRPERFLDSDGKFFKPEGFVPFQCGKRMCPGEDIAQMIMSIFVVDVLKNFQIQRTDTSPVDLSGTCGASLRPKPQEIVFRKI